MNQFLQAALHYAGIGWRVFPLAPGQKVPITSHGVKDATTDVDQITAWWREWPNANIGMACGKSSGIYVIDVDISASGDINGIDSLKEFAPLPATIKQQTPRGGFHAFYQAGIPPANRNSFRPGIDIRGDGYYVVLAPSIHPNGGRYEWAVGCAPWDRGLADFPDFMRPVTRAPWAAAPVAPASNSLRPTVPAGAERPDVAQRASLYLAQCDPAVQGQGGHDKLLWAAVALVHGFRLTDSQALDLLIREYNPRCVPPWDFSVAKDEKDFRRKVSEARRLTPREQPGWLLDDPTYTPVQGATVDVDKLVALVPQPIEEVPYITTDELYYLCQPTGLLGEICSWINSTALRAQPFLSLACSLTFLGAVFGRKIRDVGETRTNLYCMGVAPSSAGKAHAMNQIRKLCLMAGATDLLGGDDIASDTAIEERMGNWPQTLFLWDEVGLLLSAIKSGVNQHYAKVVSLLMKLYSASGSVYKGREYADQKMQRTIIQPCCCIYGTSTPERFTAGLSPTELKDGWLSRCLVFYTDTIPEKIRDNNRGAEPPKSVVELIDRWFHCTTAENDGHTINGAPVQRVIPIDNEAERIYRAFEQHAMEYGKGHPQVSSLWFKAEENARRVGLIVAAGNDCDNPVITAADAIYACRLIEYLLHDFARIIVPEIVTGQVDKDKRELMAIVRRTGVNGCRQSELTKQSSWLTKNIRANLLNDLIESGEIAYNLMRPECGKGRSGLFYWTYDNYVKSKAFNDPDIRINNDSSAATKQSAIA